MSINYQEPNVDKALLRVADYMAVAARTAPKTRGKDVIYTAIIKGQDKEKLAKEMINIADNYKMAFFKRDAQNLLDSECALLIACSINANKLSPCGMCGFPDCDEKEKHPNIPCVFNTMDMGIAIGSAISVAADFRVDNRVLYTVGQAALNLNVFGESIKVVCGIPLSATGKNIFFDRKKK